MTELPHDQSAPSIRRIWARLHATNAEDYRHLLLALAPAAAVSAFMLQPLMRFVRAESLFVAGEVVVIALVFGALYSVYSTRRGMLIFHIVMLAIGTIFVAWGATQALGPARWNDLRCAYIQKEMLRPSENTRPDLPSIFKALGCQPSGNSEPRRPNSTPHQGPPPTFDDFERYHRELSAALEAEMPLSTYVASRRANDRSCLAIQQDMLSARPKRQDGPDLFQALGCRPQGEGGVFAAPSAR